jgi:hypothetical protein
LASSALSAGFALKIPDRSTAKNADISKKAVLWLVAKTRQRWPLQSKRPVGVLIGSE